MPTAHAMRHPQRLLASSSPGRRQQQQHVRAAGVLRLAGLASFSSSIPIATSFASGLSQQQRSLDFAAAAAVEAPAIRRTTRRIVTAFLVLGTTTTPRSTVLAVRCPTNPQFCPCGSDTRSCFRRVASLRSFSSLSMSSSSNNSNRQEEESGHASREKSVGTVPAAVVATTLPGSSTTTTTTKTRYTLPESTSETDREHLRRLVHRHALHLHTYLQHKPIASHTRAALQHVRQYVDASKPVVLDSGCGTGKSSLVLGQLYPQATVLGIDRSLARLSRTYNFAFEKCRDNNDSKDNNNQVDNRRDDDENENDDTLFVQQVAENVWLIRADCVDFWHLWCLDRHLLPPIQAHYLLYPNPYPKARQISNRWYGHASFPLLFLLFDNRNQQQQSNPNEQQQENLLVVRSNWKSYLQDFAHAVEYLATAGEDMDRKEQQQDLSSCWSWKCQEQARRWMGGTTTTTRSPLTTRIQQRQPSAAAWTNFEAKYDAVGEVTYELRLVASEPPSSISTPLSSSSS